MTQDEKDLMFLDALRAQGVDNWDGYDEAVDLFNTWLAEAETEEAE